MSDGNRENDDLLESEEPKEKNIADAFGDDFWRCLEKKHGGLCVESYIRNVLNLRGYSSLNSFKDFGEKDVQDITIFMRDMYHIVLKNKFSNNSQALQAEMEKFYGPIWCYLPEKFEIGGGHLKTLQAMAKEIGPTKNVSFGRPQHFKSSQKTPSNNKKDPTDADVIIEYEEELENLLNSWLKKQNLPDFDNDGELLECKVKVSVTKNGFGSFAASVPCVFPKCESKIRLLRVKTRWVPSNYHRHIGGHLLEAGKAALSGNQRSVAELFKNRGPQSNTNSSSPEGKEGPSEEGLTINTSETRVQVHLNTSQNQISKSVPVKRLVTQRGPIQGAEDYDIIMPDPLETNDETPLESLAKRTKRCTTNQIQDDDENQDGNFV